MLVLWPLDSARYVVFLSLCGVSSLVLRPWQPPVHSAANRAGALSLAAAVLWCLAGTRPLTAWTVIRDFQRAGLAFLAGAIRSTIAIVRACTLGGTLFALQSPLNLFVSRLDVHSCIFLLDARQTF